MLSFKRRLAICFSAAWSSHQFTARVVESTSARNHRAAAPSATLANDANVIPDDLATMLDVRGRIVAENPSSRTRSCGECSEGTLLNPVRAAMKLEGSVGIFLNDKDHTSGLQKCIWYLCAVWLQLFRRWGGSRDQEGSIGTTHKGAKHLWQGADGLGSEVCSESPYSFFTYSLFNHSPVCEIPSDLELCKKGIS